MGMAQKVAEKYSSLKLYDYYAEPCQSLQETTSRV